MILAMSTYIKIHLEISSKYKSNYTKKTTKQNPYHQIIRNGYQEVIHQDIKQAISRNNPQDTVSGQL